MTWWRWLVSLFAPPAPRPVPTPAPIPEPILALFGELNAVRLQYRLPTFSLHGQLDMIATSRAETMRARGVLSHDGFQQQVAARFPHSTTAENIAQGQRTAAEVVTDWMDDPPHRANILGGYRFAGCGRSGDYWVVDFLGG